MSDGGNDWAENGVDRRADQFLDGLMGEGTPFRERLDELVASLAGATGLEGEALHEAVVAALEDDVELKAEAMRLAARSFMAAAALSGRLAVLLPDGMGTEG